MLTEAQRRMLNDLADTQTGREVFSPNLATMRALRVRGLIETRFIGMRWWHVRVTSAGRKALECAHK